MQAATRLLNANNMTAEKSDQSPVAAPGTVIAFHYDLYDDHSDKIESSVGSEPVLFLYGESHVLAALQAAFMGKYAGEDFSVNISHSHAYGRHYPERQQRIAKKQVDASKRQSFRAGQVIQISGTRGSRPATVLKVGKFNLDIDANHPLAGKDLTFDVKIISVRQASDEERAHGHGHGPGGHHHH